MKVDFGPQDAAMKKSEIQERVASLQVYSQGMQVHPICDETMRIVCFQCMQVDTLRVCSACSVLILAIVSPILPANPLPLPLVLELESAPEQHEASGGRAPIQHVLTVRSIKSTSDTFSKGRC